MLVRAGTATSILVMLPMGAPDGDLAVEVYGPDGLVGSETVTVPADAVSITINIPSSLNTLPVGGVLSYRDVTWSYMLAGAVENGEQRYSIEARVPFGVSSDGVRAKLGVDRTDLPDADISLARAYLAFRGVVGVDELALIPQDTTAVTDAIEAQAALSLIPTMAVRVATKESSGTNQYQRQAIDWDAVAAYLAGVVSAGYTAVIPTYDETADFGQIFVVVTPATDAITGETS